MADELLSADAEALAAIDADYQTHCVECFMGMPEHCTEGLAPNGQPCVTTPAQRIAWLLDVVQRVVDQRNAADAENAALAARLAEAEAEHVLDVVLDAVNTWALVQFPDATNASVVAHLREEVTELEAAPGSGEELADIVMIATSWAKRCGVDLAAEIAAKLATNRTRTWAHRDAGDYRKHEEPPDGG